MPNLPKTSLRRAIALLGITLLGLVSVLGSGGGSGGECSFFSNECNPVIGPTAGVILDPLQVTVQVGGATTIKAIVTPTEPAGTTYQWTRSTDGGANFTAIPGATGSTFTLAAANLGDDAALINVEVAIPGTLVFPSPSARLFVSSMPPVGFADAEFAPADWVASGLAQPAIGGPAFSDSTAAAGGNPGAYAGTTLTMPAGSADLRVLRVSRLADYDPARLGAIYTIDVSMDNLVTTLPSSVNAVVTGLTVEQGGRRYVSASSRILAASTWQGATWRSRTAANFSAVDGPPCAANEACPDFSATGPPLRFGYQVSASQSASAPAASMAVGIDNWKVTVWRR